MNRPVNPHTKIDSVHRVANIAFEEGVSATLKLIANDPKLRERVAEMFGKCFSETDKPTELCYDKAKVVINLIRGKE